MDETPARHALAPRIVILALAAAVVAATFALVAPRTASAAPASTVAATKLGACKQSAVKACRKVTARTCRVKTTKRLRAAGRTVSKRKIARTCAKRAARHCSSKAQKRRQARAAARCARVRPARATRSQAFAAGVAGPANTGVPAGTRLKVHRGDLTITADNAVVSGLDIRGFVVVKGDNVTIKNSIIRGGITGTINRAIVATHGGQTGLEIYDTTIKGAYPNPYLDGLKGGNFTATRIEVSNVVDTAVLFGRDATIRNSWLHGNTHFTPDPRTPDNKSHDDNIQIEGGSNFLVEGNTIEGADNAAIMVTQNWSRTSSVIVRDNFLREGSCTINLSEKAKGPITSFTIADNKFGSSRYHGTRCPMRIPRTSDVRVTNNMFMTNAIALPNLF